MSVYGELTRRAALRVAAAWIIIGWLLLQLCSLALDTLAAPRWIGAALSSLVVLGFVPAVALAWILDTGHSRPSGRLEVLTILAMMAAIVLALGERLLPGALEPAQPATAVASVAPATATPEAPPPIEIPPGSIAVLPFENRSAVADIGYFVDGIHDDLLGQLARLSALKVISRTSMMEYRESTKPLAQIGQELGVATILEASVQRAGDRVRISAQLAEASTGKHLWGESYDRELSASNVFEIQSEIARAIARELITTLSPAQVAALEADPHTTNQQAYDLYLQARATGAESIDADILRRRTLYEQAVALDPEFALALGELGIEYTNHYWYVSRDPADRDRGRRFIDRAIALAPDEPRLQYLLARHLYHGHLDYAGALAVLERAEQGIPNGAEIFELRAWILRRQGRLQESLEANERAIRLDPRNPYTILEQLDSYAALGDLPSLRRWKARLDVLPALDAVVRLLDVTRVEFYVTGQTAPLREQLDTLTPDGSDSELTELAVLLPYLERRYEAAMSAADTLLAQPATTQNRITTRALQRALVQRARGNDAEAQANAAEALQELDAFLARLPNDPRAVAARAQALAILGRADEARAAALRATELYPPTRDRFSAPDYMAARLRTLALLGDSAELAEALREYLALPAKVEHLDHLLLDPVFDRHREHPAVATKIQDRSSS